MAHTVKDYNRRNITLTTSKVGEVVPEYFGEENSKYKIAALDLGIKKNILTKYLIKNKN